MDLSPAAAVPATARIPSAARDRRLHLVLLMAIVCLGAFARLWEFGAHPAGLHQDEASIGYEAHNLLFYGVDRAGLSYPVHLVAWGSGQNAAYAYAAMPFVAVFGLTPLAVRLPMLLAGLASLALFGYIGWGLFGSKVGVFAAFLLAISPWHIMLSRWALESNLMLFWFLAGLACVVTAMRARRGQVAWMALAGALFAVCPYNYNTAYLSAPAFVAGCAAVLLFTRAVRPAAVAALLIACGVLIVPITLFVAVNALQLETMQLGPLTIPRLPGTARHVQMTVLGAESPLRQLLANADMFFNLLKDEKDGTITNTLPPYGVLYGVLLPLALGGIVVLIARAARPRVPDPASHLRRGHHLGAGVLLIWLLAAACVGVVGSMNINRASLIFLPMILAASVLIVACDARLPGIALAAALAFGGGFILFTDDYHSQGFKDRIAAEYQPGYLDALRFARDVSRERVCVQAGAGLRYAHALFADPIDPRRFADTVIYDDPQGAFRGVKRYDRISFTECDGQTHDAYVMSVQDAPPLPPGAATWSQRDLGPYRVYYVDRS
jgi:hypothetical protein